MKKFILALVMLVFPSLAMASPRARVQAEDKIPEMTAKNTVVLRGEVTSSSISRVIRQINESSEKELYLFITSPGGSIIAGNQLVYLLKTTEKKITCVANIAVSMAFVILQACENRVVLPHAIVMQHVASYGLRGEAPNNLSRVKFLHRMLKQMDEAQAKRIGMSYKEFKSKTRNDWWLFGDESVKFNVADRVGTVKCSPELTKSRIKEKVQVFFFTIDVVWSACPLVEYPVKIGDEETVKRIAETPGAASAFENLLKGYRVRDMVMEWFETGQNPFAFNH